MKLGFLACLLCLFEDDSAGELRSRVLQGSISFFYGRMFVIYQELPSWCAVYFTWTFTFFQQMETDIYSSNHANARVLISWQEKEKQKEQNELSFRKKMRHPPYVYM